MKKRYELLLTEEQERKLDQRAEALGFAKKSDYIRFMVFMELSFIEKIDQIHKKICGENARES
ncbi:MAG TPA: hypothetical protein VJH92_00100 [Candidatus Nanoarchaeia archaeon]|nr:hypothetical protein [Candidatus Nanoarchaeia archaeon]